MGLKLNGNTGMWATRITMIVGVATVIGMLYSQSVDKGRLLKTVENVEERNTAMELRIESRDVKFDTFLIQQTKKNTIDSMNTVALMKFLEQQVALNAKQLEFNGEVKEYIIRNE